MEVNNIMFFNLFVLLGLFRDEWNLQEGGGNK